MVDWRQFAVGTTVVIAVFVALAAWLDWWLLVFGAFFVLQLSLTAWHTHRKHGR